MPDTPPTDPASGSPVEPAASAQPAEVVVRYRYGDGILLEGDTYPHKDAIKKAQPRWRWFRSLRKWGVPRTRERVLSSDQVEEHARGLQRSGVPSVRVDYQEPRPEDVRDFGEVIEERNERALDRAERLEDRAERLEGQAAAEHLERRAIGDAIPMGQPILVGHHSEARHRRDVARMKAAMGREVEAIDAAEHARRRAAAAKHSVARQESPRLALRRLLELAKEARGLEVKITGEIPTGWRGELPRGPATGEWLARLQTAAEENRQKTAHYRRVLDDAGYVPSSSASLRVGDRVLTDKHPGKVRKVLSQLVEIEFDRAVRYSYGKGFENVQRLAYDRVWVAKATVEGRGRVPTEAVAVDVEAIATKHGITRSNIGDGLMLHAALVEAERLGAGAAMARHLLKTTRRQPDELARAFGRARGVAALENGTWPPPPLRGDVYGKDGYLGLLRSLDEHPVVAELLAEARTWTDRMREITGGRVERWFPRWASWARDIVLDKIEVEAMRVAQGQAPTPERARAARDSLVASAERLLQELREALDPALYDQRSTLAEVYPRLCKLDHDAARRVLEDVFGVDFEDAGEALALCEGKTTLADVAKGAARRTEAREREAAEGRAAREADARALVEVLDEVTRLGELTVRRFNLAYWRLRPELRPWERRERALTVTAKNGMVEGLVRGPNASPFHVALPSGTDEPTALAALRRELEETAGQRARTSRPYVGGGRRARRMVPFLDADRPKRKAPKEPETMDDVETEPTPAPPPAREAAPGSLWTTEEEGFALVGQHGEGTRVHAPAGHQPALFDVGKPDTAVLERMRAEELAERRAKQPPPDTSDPLLARSATEPVARLEYVDVATGVPTEPSEPGTMSTGRIVAEVDGETVEIDREDLLGHGTDPDPRKRRYPYDLESPADYPGQARAKKTARAAAQAAATKGKRKAPRVGLRTTFDSPSKAAAIFYDHNEDFFDHVVDPWDGLRDWMDGIEVRVGRGHRKLSKTPAGRRILLEEHGARAIRGALAYLMGQAKGRRWQAVPWMQVERLGEALARYFEAPGSEAGQPGIYWRPFAGELRAEDLEAMTPKLRASIREQEGAREIGEQLEALREAYARAEDCLPDDLRRVIERRIGEWSRWVEDPSKIPGHACEPDPKTEGYLCNYPAVAGELAQLRRSCDDAYDPNWAAKESKEGAAGFPDTSQGEDEAPPPRKASAKACCSTQTPKPEVCSAPACQRAAKGKRAPKPPRQERANASPPKAARGKRAAPTPPTSTKGSGPPKAKPARKLTPAERKQALVERKKDVERRRKLDAAQRRAQRLACSAAVAQHQVEAMDTVSYRRRVEDAAAAVKKAEEHVKEHERELKAAMREAEAVMRKRNAVPMDRELARRKVRDARCQLGVAQGALRQRRRDHLRAQTELRRALVRVGKREAIAHSRLEEANRASAEASAQASERR